MTYLLNFQFERKELNITFSRLFPIRTSMPENEYMILLVLPKIKKQVKRKRNNSVSSAIFPSVIYLLAGAKREIKIIPIFVGGVGFKIF